jgi:AcrR family transcriptional regulator
MSPANIDRFFPSKDAICQAVCRRLLGDLISVAGELPQRNATDRLRALLSALTRFNIEQFRANEPLRQLFASATDENWPVMREYLDRMKTILAAVIGDGIRRGEFREADARRAARCVCASMLQHLHPAADLMCDDRARASVDDMLNFCLAALRDCELCRD